MTDDALFPTPGAVDPDEAIAREEITRYYEDRVTEARAALDKAQQKFDARVRERIEWHAAGRITHDGMDGKTVGEASMISSHATSRYMKAAQAAIYRGGDRAEAERLGEREKALRRWLTAQGHDLGALAEPAPEASKRKRGKR